jgi:hypothetical protein
MKSLTTEEFIERARKIHSNQYDYTRVQYFTAKKKIEIGCKKHGYFWQEAYSHISGCGCNDCGRQKTTNKQRRSLQDFVEKAFSIHGNIYRYDFYVNSITPIEIFCKKHNDYFTQMPREHLQGYGCNVCGGTLKSNFNNFVKKSSIIHKNKYSYSNFDYLSNKQKIEIICPIHKIFNQTIDNHLANHGCPKCSKIISKGETKWLNSLGLPDDKEHRQLKLKLHTGKYVKVDGFNPLTNTAYEFWGDYWHGNPNKFDQAAIHPVIKKSYGYLYSRTIQKIKDIESSGYNLVQIWESDFKLP